MSAEYMHIGIPVTNRKPGMTYNEGATCWVSNVDDDPPQSPCAQYGVRPGEVHRRRRLCHLRPHGRQRQGGPAGLRVEGRGHSGAVPGGLNLLGRGDLLRLSHPSNITFSLILAFAA